jgi:2-hydroxychromene-2-carboxylate isomerase
MTPVICFYFDIISPYGYFAAERIGALAERCGARIDWRPFHMRQVNAEELGVTAPLFMQPLKGPYFAQDVPRMARWFDLPFAPPPIAEVSSVAVHRAIWFWKDQGNEAAAAALSLAAFRATHAKTRNLSAPEAVCALADEIGQDGAALRAALGDPAVKDRLRAETAAAVAAGVWGTPTFAVGDQLFWGSDRLDQVEAWVARGGW